MTILLSHIIMTIVLSRVVSISSVFYSSIDIEWFSIPMIPGITYGTTCGLSYKKLLLALLLPPPVCLVINNQLCYYHGMSFYTFESCTLGVTE